MATDTAHIDLAALIGSRICHDLISPIGAIDNGLELLGMAGGTMGPELELINDSVASASARIRFFRLAFGAASDQPVSNQEIRSILKDMSAGQKLKLEWRSTTSAPRNDVRALFLAEQCIESAMPYGGDIVIEQTDSGWSVTGFSTKFNVDEKLWSILGGAPIPKDTLPAHVHYPLLALQCQDENRVLHCQLSADRITITL